MCDIVSHIIFLHQTLIIVSPWEKKNAYWHGNTKTITKALPLYQDKLNRIVILLNGHRCWVLNSFLTQPFFLEVLRNFMGNDTSWKTQRVLLLMSVESTLLTCSSSCKTHASSNSWATKTKGWALLCSFPLTILWEVYHLCPWGSSFLCDNNCYGKYT